MKLQDVLDVVTTSHVTVWQSDAQGKFVVVAKGSSRRKEPFEGHIEKEVVKISCTDWGKIAITVK